MELKSVVIPDEVPVYRLSNPRNSLEEHEKPYFDYKTIFFDVFIDGKEARLIAVGPAALNLEGYVRDLVLTVNDVPVKFEFEEYEQHKLSVLKASVPKASSCKVSFAFKDFAVEHELQAGYLPEGSSVLAAISKNNAINWISDWVDHYKSNYSVDEVYIYDNGSDNVEELEQALQGRAKIIRWNFPFGPPEKRFNMFAQVGALNHCLRRFAKHGTLFNFDIDELLVAGEEDVKKSLSEGVVYFNSYLVPYRDPGKQCYSYSDFKYRCPDIKKTARKFICRSDAVDVISYHNTWTCKQLLFKRFLKRNKPERLESGSGYFMHFLGITTNWQPRLGKLEEVPLETLVRDTSHIEMKPNGE